MSLSEQEDTAAYKPAIDKAKKRLARTEVTEIIDKTGLEFLEEENQFVIPALNQKYYAKYPTGEITSSNPEIPVALGMKIIILHFLIRGDNWAPTGELISYKELPSGNVYSDAFQREAIDPIVEKLCHHPKDLIKDAARKLGAEFKDKGDLSFTIQGLPTIPLTYIIWFGDEELPGGANILFDTSVVTKLHTEDLAFLGQYVSSLLIKFTQLD